jgi:hypothetical protein
MKASGDGNEMTASSKENTDSNNETETSKRFRSVKCNANGRIFVIEVLLFRNGCFIAMSEDQNPRIGAITLSVKTDNRTPSSSSILPERKGSLFAGMVGELLAEKLGGMAVVSLYLREEIDPEIMKKLINEVKKLLSKNLSSAP